MPNAALTVVLVILAILVGAFLAVRLLRWWAIRRVSRLMGMDGFSAAQLIMSRLIADHAMNLQLEPADRASVPVDPEALQKLEADFMAMGFVPAGLFTSPAAAGMVLAGFADEQRNMYGVANASELQGVFGEVFSVCDDEWAVNHTASPAPAPSTGEWLTVTHCPNADVASLIEQHLHQRPEGASSARASEFAEVYAAQIRRMLLDSVGRSLESGNLEAKPSSQSEAVPQPAANRRVRAVVADGQQEAILQAFSREHGIAQERIALASHRLFCVHDGSEPVDLIYQLAECSLLTHEANDPNAMWLSEQIARGSPRQVFADFVAGHHHSERLRKIGEVTSPMAADIYLREPFLVGDAADL